MFFANRLCLSLSLFLVYEIASGYEQLVFSGGAHVIVSYFMKRVYLGPDPDAIVRRVAKKYSLDEVQRRILGRAVNGENVFFTGCAGTGKSHLTRAIVEGIRETRRSLAVTASTGIAAVNIGGQTLNKFAGVGLANSASSLRGVYHSDSHANWTLTDVLVIGIYAPLSPPVLRDCSVSDSKTRYRWSEQSCLTAWME